MWHCRLGYMALHVRVYKCLHSANGLHLSSNKLACAYPVQAASSTRCVFYDVELNGECLLHQNSMTLSEST